MTLDSRKTGKFGEIPKKTAIVSMAMSGSYQGEVKTVYKHMKTVGTANE